MVTVYKKAVVEAANEGPREKTRPGTRVRSEEKVNECSRCSRLRSRLASRRLAIASSEQTFHEEFHGRGDNDEGQQSG